MGQITKQRGAAEQKNTLHRLGAGESDVPTKTHRGDNRQRTAQVHRNGAARLYEHHCKRHAKNLWPSVRSEPTPMKGLLVTDIQPLANPWRGAAPLRRSCESSPLNNPGTLCFVAEDICGLGVRRTHLIDQGPRDAKPAPVRH